MTIKEVAHACGLSVATVSRVLSGKASVRKETCERVLGAVNRLNWAPNGAARSLTTRKTNTIGVLLPDIYGEFFSEVIRGIDGVGRRNGYHVIVSGAHGDAEETNDVLRAMRGRVDGLLVMAPQLGEDRLRAALPAGFPVILLNAPGPRGFFGSLGVDNHGGARAMARHLLSLGHRRVAIITGPRGNHDADERVRGFREALAAAGIPADEAVEVEGDFSEEAGFRAGRRIAALRPRPTAVFASNDSMAIACLAALQGAGLRVPEDVALAGFDDVPVARYVTPALTSAHVSIDGLGERAMERLLQAVETGEPDRRHESVAPTLVVRASCGGAGPTTRARGPRQALPGRSETSDERDPVRSQEEGKR